MLAVPFAATTDIYAGSCIDLKDANIEVLTQMQIRSPAKQD